MNISIKIFSSSLILFLFSFCALSKTCEFTRTSVPGETKYVEQYSIKTDKEGHAVRVFKTETIFKKREKNCDGLKAISSMTWGFSDYTFKNGKVSGYWSTTYEDESTMYGTWQGTSQSPKDQNKNSINISTQIITGGTGLYSSVTGYGVSNGEFNPEKGYSKNKLTMYYNKN